MHNKTSAFDARLHAFSFVPWKVVKDFANRDLAAVAHSEVLNP
jgi:hypothetical protein